MKTVFTEIVKKKRQYKYYCCHSTRHCGIISQQVLPFLRFIKGLSFRLVAQASGTRSSYLIMVGSPPTYPALPKKCDAAVRLSKYFFTVHPYHRGLHVLLDESRIERRYVLFVLDRHILHWTMMLTTFTEMLSVFRGYFDV